MPQRPPRASAGAAVARHERAFAVHDPRRALGRLVLAVAVGLGTAAAVPTRFGPLRAVAGWDAAALTMGALAWWIVARFSPDETRRRAAAADPGRTAVWLLVLVASGFSLFATAGVMRQARALGPEARDLMVGLCALAVACAWGLTHTAYTLRYAHLFYRDDDEGEGGLTFPGEEHPSYMEFAYFAFTVGMCFQVSDVGVTSRQIRRAVLAHSILSFAYNTVILAVAINLVISIMG
jgi:uncharacterized membrane protein